MRFVETSGKVSDQCQSRKQAPDRERNRENDVERREAELAALIVERDIERERRERRVAAEDAGREKEAPMLRGVALEGEVGRKQAHHQRAGNVLEQRREGKRCAEEPREDEIDAMAQRRADAAAEEDDQKPHRAMPFFALPVVRFGGTIAQILGACRTLNTASRFCEPLPNPHVTRKRRRGLVLAASPGSCGPGT